jgi:two-component system sensor histidine kinase RpfC
MWVTIGNGLRYGNRYLFCAVAMAGVGFGSGDAGHAYWQANLSLAWACWWAWWRCRCTCPACCAS